MKTRRRPDLAFVFQAALIVLPVTILSGVAWYYLREDKSSIEQEARARARVLAPELARVIGERLVDRIERHGVLEGVIINGRIQTPPDYPPLPEPPDEPAMASASYRALVFESKRAVSPGFVQRCIGLAKTAGVARTESGAPIRDLALLLALRQTGSAPIPEALLAELKRAVLEHPSFLTPELLAAAAHAPIDELKATWESRQTALALLRTLQPQLTDAGGPREIRLSEAGRSFLALCNPIRGGWQVSLSPSAEIDQMVTDVLRESRYEIPVFTRPVLAIGGPRPAASVPILASAPGLLRTGAPHPFTLDLDLIDPAALYAGYRRRMWLTAALILSAVAAAMAGLAGLWRNSRRQILLGEMKSNFVSSVSHELRAPIAAMQLMAESLERGKVADESRKQMYFHLIVQECRRLSSLVENVLDFSRIDRGSKRYSFEPTDVAALAGQAVALMEPCAAERQIRLAMAVPRCDLAELRPCWDGHAVEQSLVNLIDNAIKHSPAGAEVKLEIEIGQQPETVRLWVEDHGEGIPQEEQTKIFDLFYRHGPELRRETKGAGIGLSIVKHVAEAHRGRVIVESVVGRGSRFAMELPL